MKKLTSALLISLLVGTLSTGCELKLNNDTNTSAQTGTQTGNTSNETDTNVSTGTDTNTSTGNQTNTGTATATCSTAEIDVAVGSEVSDDFFCSYGPAQVKAGTKWTYTTQAAGTSTDMSIEFLNVTNDEVTVKTTVNGNSTETKTKTSTSTKPTTNSNAKFTFQGYEDVTVPAGTYNGAAKVMVTESSNGADMELTYFMAKGVGMVKINTKTKVSGVSIDIPAVETVLKSFTP